MITISAPLFQAMEQARWRAFVLKLAGHLGAHHLRSIDQLPDDALQAFTADVVRVGYDNGFRAEDDLRRFAEVCLAHGPDHEIMEDPEFCKVIQAHAYKPWQRLNRLEATMAARMSPDRQTDLPFDQL